jgi:hypothetical protein
MTLHRVLRLVELRWQQHPFDSSGVVAVAYFPSTEQAEDAHGQYILSEIQSKSMLTNPSRVLHCDAPSSVMRMPTFDRVCD